MRQLQLIQASLYITSMLAIAAPAQELNPAEFSVPPPEYRPAVTIDEGAGYNAPLEVATDRAIHTLAAGGIMFNPQGNPDRQKPFDYAGLSKLTVGLLREYPPHASPWLPKALPEEERFGSYLKDGGAGPGKPASLGYMTDEWFSSIGNILDTARQQGRYAIYYDEAGFPSGSADGTVPPKYHRKILRRQETSVSAGQTYDLSCSDDEQPLALIALDTSTGEQIDLLSLVKNGEISWKAPHGNWQVQRYFITVSTARTEVPDYYGTADYLDPDASQWFIQNSYDRAYHGLSPYFGSVIEYTFFDDVGIFNEEKTWHPSIGARFEEITGRPASRYYPALWQNIGPDTAAARVGFFRARSEILGETFPKLVTEWAHQHDVKSMGHAPGNYDLQPTATVGDPFKFYGHTDVPTADALWGLGYARGGFKLISSVSAQRDLPLTAAEVFSVDNDANGYRRMIELFVRGFNLFITGAREPSSPHGSPAQLYEWAGRSSFLLRGGRHIADIAVLYPIESLQAFYYFNAPENSADLPSGTYVYREADYQAIGEILLGDLHRDFTFIHPDTLGSDQMQVSDGTLQMMNKENRAQFRALLLPGGEVLSAAALAKINDFWVSGGTVIATSLLPSRSAEFGRDSEVKKLIAEIFGENSAQTSPASIRRNANGGQAVFLPRPSAELLAATLIQLQLTPDVAFKDNPSPTTGNGTFGYIHRQRDGKDIYYFGNSSDTPVNTVVSLRGKLTDVALWNPHDGTISPVEKVQFLERAGEVVTELDLLIPPVAAMAIVAQRK